LELKVREHVTGRLRQNGAPLGRSRISLQRFRDQEKVTIFKEVITDNKGRFDFGVVTPGRYRFLPTPSRVFSQPTQAACVEGETCAVNLVVEANPAEQGLTSCPVE
jgi:hypothetical protein